MLYGVTGSWVSQIYRRDFVNWEFSPVDVNHMAWGVYCNVPWCLLYGSLNSDIYLVLCIGRVCTQSPVPMSFGLVAQLANLSDEAEKIVIHGL